MLNDKLMPLHQFTPSLSPPSLRASSAIRNRACLARFTDICGGYLSFVVSILCIGVVTAVIGDVASHFGCTLGIKDSVTAIVFVALGTSIPGE